MYKSFQIHVVQYNVDYLIEIQVCLLVLGTIVSYVLVVNKRLSVCKFGTNILGLFLSSIMLSEDVMPFMC